MSISIKSNTDGVSGALQVNGTDVLTFTSAGNISIAGTANITGNATTATTAGGLTGTPLFGYSVSGQNIELNGQGGPQVQSQGSGAAMVSFHRPDVYAINFGLGTDNQLRTGGWSRGGSYVILDSGNYNSYSPTLTGTGANGTWGINVSGNATTATNLSTNSSNWNTNGALSAVVGQLGWRNYANNHTIFDASAGLAPNGTAVNNTNSTVVWAGTYPTLMGWNGAQTYGVRVDSARLADTATSATSANSIDGIAFNNSNSTTPVSAPDSLDSNGIGYVTSVSLLGQTDGALYSQAYSSSWQHQIYGDYRTGQLVVRGKNNNTWQAWRTVLDSTNWSSYVNYIPQNIQSAAYSLILTDAGKHILHPSADTTARIFTIPANASVAFPIGTAVTFINQASAGVVTIAITTDVMRLAGAGTTGSRTLAANGIATAIKLTATEWIISGTGLT